MCPYVSINETLINVHKCISYVNILKIASVVENDAYEKKSGMSYGNILDLCLRTFYHRI